MLKYDFNVVYEERDSVGKRYTRQDLIGTPFCITVDYETLEDNAVTIRYRDTMEQKRIAITDLHSLINKEVSFKSILELLK